jgi:hypothetical protein
VFPGSPLAATKEELQKLAGFWPDIERSRAEARRLLKEAGQEGLHFELLNRNVDQPYKYVGTWLVDQWSKIGRYAAWFLFRRDVRLTRVALVFAPEGVHDAPDSAIMIVHQISEAMSSSVAPLTCRLLETLRLEDTNDAKYLMGDPRREVWVGPSVDASSGGTAVKERWYRNQFISTGYPQYQ